MMHLPFPRLAQSRRLLALLLGLLLVPARIGAQDMAFKSNPRLSGKAGFRVLDISYVSAKGEARQRKLYLWYPTSDEPHEHRYPIQLGVVALDGKVAEGRHPLILFSHGYMGSADQSLFITEALARSGYVVVSTNHADSLAGGHPFRQPLPRFGSPRTWSDQNFEDRKEDLEALLDRVLKLDGDPDSFLHARIRKDQIGAMGHSLGGYTILGLAGAWPSWRDERIRAALALSPYSAPFNEHMAAGSLTIPVMLQGGTLDMGITPTLPATYAKLAAPRYFLVLKKATHFEWTNFASAKETTVEAVEKPGNPALIVDYSVAFFDHALLHREAPLLTKTNDALESYRFEEGKE